MSHAAHVRLGSNPVAVRGTAAVATHPTPVVGVFTPSWTHDCEHPKKWQRMPTLLFDRHLEKNGGTSARHLLHDLERDGRCVYWGYSHDWRKTLRLLHEAANQDEEDPLPPLCIEAHTSVSQHDLRRLHESCSSVKFHCVTWLRWRSPDDHFLSFFSWAILPRMRLSENAAPSAFLQWVRLHPNLQSEILLDSGAALTAALWNGSDVRAPKPGAGWRLPETADGIAELRRATASIVGLFTVVGTTESLDTSSRQALRRLGWREPATESLREYATVCHNRARYWWCVNDSLPVEMERRRIRHTLCPDPSACARAVAAASKLDREMHAQATANELQPVASATEQQQGAVAQAARESTPRCAWKRMCRRGWGCVRRRGWDFQRRLDAAPSFVKPGKSALCFRAGSEAGAANQILRLAWAEHPHGGRVLPGRPMLQLVHLQHGSSPQSPQGKQAPGRAV